MFSDPNEKENALVCLCQSLFTLKREIDFPEKEPAQRSWS